MLLLFRCPTTTFGQKITTCCYCFHSKTLSYSSKSVFGLIEVGEGVEGGKSFTFKSDQLFCRIWGFEAKNLGCMSRINYTLNLKSVNFCLDKNIWYIFYLYFLKICLWINLINLCLCSKGSIYLSFLIEFQSAHNRSNQGLRGKVIYINLLYKPGVYYYSSILLWFILHYNMYVHNGKLR